MRRPLGLMPLLVVAVLVVPLAVEAQPAPNVPHIGFLAPNSPTDPRALRFLQAFRQGLRELGYVEGQNIAIDFRSADVMTAVADPVALGFVDSLGHPGRNITGLSSIQSELIGKRLEVLKEVVPKVSLVAVLANPANPNYAPLLRQAQDAAPALGVRLQSVEARDPREIDSAFAAITTAGAGAVLVVGDPMFRDHRTRIAEHAIRRRLPAVFVGTEFAEAGGLLAYGPSLSEGYRRAANYVDKILKGAKATDLPIEQPVPFELVIKLKTAKARGLTIPQALLRRADQLIQ